MRRPRSRSRRRLGAERGNAAAETALRAGNLRICHPAQLGKCIIARAARLRCLFRSLAGGRRHIFRRGPATIVERYAEGVGAIEKDLFTAARLAWGTFMLNNLHRCLATQRPAPNPAQ